MPETKSNNPDLRSPQRLASVDTWRGVCLWLMLPTVAVAYSFNLTSFLQAKETLLCAWLVLMSVLALIGRRHTWDGFIAFLPLWALLVPALLYVIAGSVRVPSDAVVEASRWVLILLIPALSFDLLSHGSWRKRIECSVVSSTVAVAVLGLVQYARVCPGLFPEFEGYTQRVYSVFGNQDLFGGYVGLGIPLVAHRFASAVRDPESGGRRASASLVLLAVLTCALLVSGSRSAWLAVLAGLSVSLGQSGVDRLRIVPVAIVLGFATLATVLIAPEATVQRAKQTFSHTDEGRDTRWWLWQAGLRMFGDAPMMGLGLGQYAYWSPRYVGDCVAEAQQMPGFDIERYADHPHSELVKILAETGLVGVVCWIWMLSRLLRRRSPWNGSLAAFAVFALFNGPFQSVAHSGTAIVLATLLQADDDCPVRPSRWAGLALTALTVMVAAFEIWAVVIPGHGRQRADDAHLAGQPVLDAYARLTRYPWPSAAAHKGYAIALADADRERAAYAELLRALDGLDTGDIYLGLAIIAYRLDNRDAARQWAVECLRRWPSNETALNLLDKVEGSARDHATSDIRGDPTR